jgi:hypothetical protein
MRRKKSCSEVGASLGMSHRPGISLLLHTRPKGGTEPALAVLLSLSPQHQRHRWVKGGSRWEWLEFFIPFCLTICVKLQPDIISCLQKWHLSIRMERERICGTLTFKLPMNSGHCRQKDTLPRMRTGKRRPGNTQSLPIQETWLPPSPRSPRLDLSLPGHLSSISLTLWKPWSVVFLHCTVSVIKSVNPC